MAYRSGDLVEWIPEGTGLPLRATGLELSAIAAAVEILDGRLVEVTARERGDYGRWRTMPVRTWGKKR